MAPRPKWSKITKIEKSLNFCNFYELWRVIVPSVNICWTWNFACLFKHTRTANIRNINIFEYKMHVRRASKVCTCSDVQICVNFRMLLLRDFMSDWLEILHACWCSLGQTLHEYFEAPFWKMCVARANEILHVQNQYILINCSDYCLTILIDALPFLLEILVLLCLKSLFSVT